MARVDPRSYEWRRTGNTEYLYKKGSASPAVFITPGCLQSARFSSPHAITSASGTVYHTKNVDINLFHIEGARLFANVCITAKVFGIRAQVQSWIEDDQPASCVTMATRMAIRKSAFLPFAGFSRII